MNKQREFLKVLMPLKTPVIICPCCGKSIWETEHGLDLDHKQIGCPTTNEFFNGFYEKKPDVVQI